jgi:hypothetical protein
MIQSGYGAIALECSAASKTSFAMCDWIERLVWTDHGIISPLSRRNNESTNCYAAATI